LTIQTEKVDSSHCICSPSDFLAKLARKILLKNGGFWTENLRASAFFRTFVLSIRNTADTLKSQPDTRAGKPNKQQL
jgi:hypothetical protein